jgi:hypothetical protein
MAAANVIVLLAVVGIIALAVNQKK